MEKAIAKKIQKELKELDFCTTYYSSRKGELRVMYEQYTQNPVNAEERVKKIFTAVGKCGHPFFYEYSHKVYQGFVHCDYVIFS